MQYISLEFSGFEELVIAQLQESAPQAMRDQLWSELETPVRMWTWQTTSSGDYFSAKGRPLRTPQTVGNQHIPLAGALRMCDAPVGSIIYCGPRYISAVYSDDVTESLPCGGPVIATVTNLDLFYRAGLHIRASHFETHQLVTVTLARIDSKEMANA